MSHRRVCLFLFFSTIISACSFAHSTDETYIWLNPQSDHFDGLIEIRLPDVRQYFDIEISGDFETAKAAVPAIAPALQEYIKSHFSLKNIDGSPIEYEIVKTDLLEADYFGHFVQFFFRTAPLEVPSQIQVSSTLLFEHDPFSRSLLCMQYNHFTGESFPEAYHHEVFSPRNPSAEIDFLRTVSVPFGRKYYIKEGVRHIWIGIDHVLFLITLLLPAVFVRRSTSSPSSASDSSSSSTEWVPVKSFRQGLWNICKIVTVFTIAHSITLYLASLDIFTLPAQIVESVIAFSIIMVAIGNFVPALRQHSWIILFVFGLFHGMGFASVLQDLPFRMSNLPRLLICFNGGVELGQLAIVAVVFPILFFLRYSKLYRPVILMGGSIVITVFASFWLYERVFTWS